MSTFKNLSLSRKFKKYITIKGFTGEEYTYKKRSDKNYRVVDIELHKEKCKPGSWLYIAVEGNSDVIDLDDSQKLYVGSQTKDRMFRGDNLDGKNFHHEQIREVNGQNILEEYLEIGGTVDIFIIGKDILEELAAQVTELQFVSAILADASLKRTDQPGWWYEQIILSEEKESWSWNIKGAGSEVKKAVKKYMQA